MNADEPIETKAEVVEGRAPSTTTIVGVEKPVPPLRRAFDALEDLVDATLRSGKRTRFADAERICKIGQELMRATAEGVDEHTADLYGCGGARIQVGDGINVAYAPVRGDAHQNALDQLGVLRDLVAPLTKQAEAGAKQQEARAGSDRADELVALQQALDAAAPEHRARISARIEVLLAQIDGGEKTGDEAQPAEPVQPSRVRINGVNGAGGAA